MSLAVLGFISLPSRLVESAIALSVIAALYGLAFGVSALRMTMAYHAERMPADLQRADHHVSSNIGRTIHASRQSIIDVRACLDWLNQQGYERVGILGTSLGSCVAFIAAAHDARV